MNGDSGRTDTDKEEIKWSYLLLDFIVGTFFICIVGGVVMLIGLTLFMQDTFCKPGAINGVDYLHRVICWFDPVFMTYNLALLLLLVMVVPIITLCYVRTMRKQKKARLPQEILENEIYAKRINKYLNNSFRMSHYAGSMTMLSIVILLGGMIILLLKPMAMGDAEPGYGIDYSKGANFLMLGSYMHYFVEGNKQEYMRVLIGTLTAFQFGFLGAYVYFITHLVRSFFTLDLSPNIYISCTVRIMMGSILSLVLSFLFISGAVDQGVEKAGQAEENSLIQESVQTEITNMDETTTANTLETDKEQVYGLVMSKYYYYLPLISFFIGFFPLRGLLFIERTAGGLLHTFNPKYQSTNLTSLSGMSYQHEIRLNREGFDNVENFVSADVIDLSIRTGFSYQQLSVWKSQAKLVTHLGSDYARFQQATSIDSADELIKNKSWFSGVNNDGALSIVIDEALYQKVKITLNTLQLEEMEKAS